jgi:hypothetical protein
MKPHEVELVSMWMGRTQTDVVKDNQNEFFEMSKVQWWVPMKKRLDINE